MFKRASYGVSSLVVIVSLLLVASSTLLAMSLMGILKFDKLSITQQPSNITISSLGEAVNDLEKSGCTVIEADSMPTDKITETISTFSEFKKVAQNTQTVNYVSEPTKCLLYIEKDNRIFTWAPLIWEKLKIIDVICSSEKPGWQINVELKNSGNQPAVISKIFIAGDEIPSSNYDTEDFLPLSVSCNIKGSTKINPDSLLTVQIRLSDFYKYSKPGTVVEIKFISASGSITKKMVNLIARSK